MMVVVDCKIMTRFSNISMLESFGQNFLFEETTVHHQKPFSVLCTRLSTIVSFGLFSCEHERKFRIQESLPDYAALSRLCASGRTLILAQALWL